MPPARKKAKKVDTAEPSSSGSADPPAQKKRGRPRKIVVKEEEEEDQGYKSSSSIAIAAAEQEAFKARAKLPHAVAAIQGSSSGMGEAASNGGKILSEPASAIKAPPAAKRDGRRRKSEPHRAPGVLIEGFL